MTPASHPAPDRYTVVLRPGPPGIQDAKGHDAVVRTARVEATGATGVSGYPRYEGEGVQAEIDPESRAVEAVTVDGEELPYGWTAQLAADDPDRRRT
ncbi:hypothetical protein ACFXJO_26285 [Streptomyces lavendulae]|uniref:hypothetical protein n=1 Tax=Streptomyces TaxID=1883 RepID=UPI002476962B|nr:hypothetical protein [Streptomyces sp. SPB4]MDH6545722.1 hypothetical protein [Streptomyces sp. SPB4]